MSTLDERIAASREYDMLQGLTVAGLGVGMVIGALTRQSLWFVVATGASMAICVQYYRRRFGHRQESRSRNLAAAGIGLVVALLLCTGFLLDEYHSGGPAWGLAIAAITLGTGYWIGERHIGLTVGHVAVLVLLALASLLPLVGPQASFLLDVGTTGVALVVIGVIDHLRLVRMFGTGGPR